MPISDELCFLNKETLDILEAHSGETNIITFDIIKRNKVFLRCVNAEFLLNLSRLLRLACNVNNEVMEVYYLTLEDPHVVHVWSVIRIIVHPTRLTYGR